MVLSKYFLWFIIYSFTGWILETVGCVVEKHRWENRGFLYGAILPIYGFGGVGITIVNDMLNSYGFTPTIISTFCISFAGSAIIEYSTSYFLEKLFHARWWDYTDRPMNINGRICLPFLVLFGTAGVIIVNFTAPFLRALTDKISPLTLELISLAGISLISCDMTLTAVALTDFEKRVVTIDNSVNRYMSNLVEELNRKLEEKESVREERRMIVISRIRELQQQINNERENVQRDRLENSFKYMSGRNAIRRIRKLTPLKKHTSDTHELMRNKSFEQVKKSDKSNDTDVKRKI